MISTPHHPQLRPSHTTASCPFSAARCSGGRSSARCARCAGCGSARLRAVPGEVAEMVPGEVGNLQ